MIRAGRQPEGGRARGPAGGGPAAGDRLTRRAGLCALLGLLAAGAATAWAAEPGAAPATATGTQSRPASAPATADSPPADRITARPRTTVTFSLAAPASRPTPPDTPTAQATPPTYAVAGVLRNGRAAPLPPNLGLDANTGAFSWTPTESQAGSYEVAFLVRRAGGDESQTVRRIDVTPGESTTDGGEVGKLLRAWWRDGAAAGNVGDFYDNRDGGHSQLNTARFPQLDRIEYPPELRKRRLHWGLQVHFIHPAVTFGNSSTASGDMAFGSNPRHALLSPRAVDVLYQQYRRAHLYVYPEHRDHDPGHNGRGGYGDLFPANIPYVIISQGSSGSDQPFLSAAAHTLAAFRPETKRRLIETGLLMPAVQMILRSCSRKLKEPAEYLTGAAHPTAFEGGDVDALKMVRMAHAMPAEAIPPMIQIAVLEEDAAVEGRDYFDAGRLEKLFDTPAAIARIVRSVRYSRRMVLSAEKSFDANGRAIKFHWVVLRGDAERITVKPLNAAGSRVELLVPWHDRRPVQPGSKLQSNRVDIGAFVDNGAYYSAPGFVSLFYLDSEARTYRADGRVLEVAYDRGEATIGYEREPLRLRDGGYDVADWPGLLAVLDGPADSLAVSLLRKHFTAEEVEALRRVATKLAEADKALEAPRKALEAAEAALKAARAAADQAVKAAKAAGAASKATTTGSGPVSAPTTEAAQAELKRAEQDRSQAARKLEDAEKAAASILTARQDRLGGSPKDRLGGSPKDRLEKALNEIKDDAGLYSHHAEAIEGLANAAGDQTGVRKFQAARLEMVRLGIAGVEDNRRSESGPTTESRPSTGRSESGPARDLTAYERNRLEWFNIAILQDLLYPGLVRRSYQRNYVNPLLATPKSWRDVYHYDDGGQLLGWTRYDGPDRHDFTAQGELVVRRDELGRPLEVREVRYAVVMDRDRPRELRQQPREEHFHYEYAGPADRTGRRKPAPAAK